MNFKAKRAGTRHSDERKQDACVPKKQTYGRFADVVWIFDPQDDKERHGLRALITLARGDESARQLVVLIE